jgi:hypothetical protein
VREKQNWLKKINQPWESVGALSNYKLILNTKDPDLKTKL